MVHRAFAAGFLALSFAAPALADDAVAPAPDITGRWAGCWVSDTNGHRGPLRATICALGDDCYRARFRGRFFGVIPFRYATTLRLEGRDGEALILSASLNLGPLLGTFRMTAAVTVADFQANFASRSDRGRFIMQRVGP